MKKNAKEWEEKKHLSKAALQNNSTFFLTDEKPSFYKKPKKFHCSGSTIQPWQKEKSAGDASLHSEPISRQHLQNHSTISRQHLLELEARAHTQWFNQYCVIGMFKTTRKTGRWRHGKQRRSVPMCAGDSGSINMPDYDSFRMNTHPWRV